MTETAKSNLGEYSKPHEDIQQCQIARVGLDPEIDRYLPTHRLDFTGALVGLEAVATDSSKSLCTRYHNILWKTHRFECKDF